MIIFQLTVGKMIPSATYNERKDNVENPCLRAGIPIEQCRRLGYLFAILTPLALESVMCVAECFFIELEQLA